MGEIFEGAIRIVWGFLRWLLWELYFRMVFFNIGRGFLMVISLGRYPHRELTQDRYDRIAVLGLMLVLGGLVSVALLNHYG